MQIEAGNHPDLVLENYSLPRALYPIYTKTFLLVYAVHIPIFFIFSPSWLRRDIRLINSSRVRRDVLEVLRAKVKS